MRKYALRSILIMTMLLVALTGHTRQESQDSAVSGQLQKGYRVLTVPSEQAQLSYTVYRGDYIKFKFPAGDDGGLLKIPALSIEKHLTGNFQDTPYFKMKVTGTYALELGKMWGQIAVIDYRQSNYRELTVDQAAVILKNESPLLLDVRTPAEFKRGHLKGAVLIPVQQLQQRLKELNAYKGQDILLYCATGNRSTVASKILIDNGFTRILNMRRGIVGWSQHYPVVR